MPYPAHDSQPKPGRLTDPTPPATPSTNVPLQAAYSPPDIMQDNPLAQSPDLAHASPSMQDDSSQADSWPQQQLPDGPVRHDGGMSHQDGSTGHDGDMSHSQQDAHFQGSGGLEVPLQQQQQQLAEGASPGQWMAQPLGMGRQPDLGQGGQLAANLNAQLQSADMTSMQSDEILMHAAGDEPIPGGMTANPMYDVQKNRSTR